MSVHVGCSTFNSWCNWFICLTPWWCNVGGAFCITANVCRYCMYIITLQHPLGNINIFFSNGHFRISANACCAKLQGYKAYIDDGSVPAQNVEEARKLKDSLGQEPLGKVLPVAGPNAISHGFQRVNSGSCLRTWRRSPKRLEVRPNIGPKNGWPQVRNWGCEQHRFLQKRGSPKSSC